MSIAVPYLSRFSRTLLLALLVLATGPLTDSASAYSVPVPSQLILNVRETAGIARSNEVVRSGIPIPRSLNLSGTGALAVVDAAGKAVPAEFLVTARWNAGLSNTSAPIQWLLVTFPASVSANGSTAYRLVTNGSVANPAPTRPLRLTQNGNLITVDTGAAVFRFGSDPGALFEEVLLDNGTRLIGGGDLSLRANGTAAGHSTTRKIRIEHAGPLSAVVVVHGAYDLAPIGNGQMGTVRRYVFTAGSPTAVVRHVVQWEGNLACNGCTKTTSGTANGVRLQQVRDTLSVELGGTPSVTAVGDFDAAAVTKSVGSGQTASVRQLLRSSRTAPLSFKVDVAGSTAGGVQADGGMLAASGTAGAVAVGLSRMHRYEPQALRVLADGSLAIDLADGDAWLAHHQGMFAEMAVSALAPNPTRAALDRQVWAPLNRPLRAWPQAAWFASSDAVDEFPVGNLPASLASYDTLIPSVLNRTLAKTDELGLAGLTTYGVFPRYWGKDSSPGEVDCTGSTDPTPNEPWDDKFWCGTWTDYHNTASTVPIWAMRSGQVEWLDEISVPAALRTLHTQMMRCGPTEKWFYCGQAPSGYGGYRSDFNSSHAYFENLYLYYWLTGDSTVTETLRRGGENMRRMQCDTRGSKPVIEPLTGPGGPACGADHLSTTSEFTGRVPSQWINAFRFLGLASEDGTFLEDFRSSMARAVTQHYVEARRDGVTYGFLGERAVAAGTYLDGPLWMQGFYDSNNLFRLLRDTGDAPTGNPALPPSRVLTTLARTLQDVATTVMGDGTTDGAWPVNVEYTYSGSRVGGTLVSTGPNDRRLYTPEKSCMTALFLRAAELSGDSALQRRGEELVQLTLTTAAGENVPLGKLHGQYLTRLHAAVARVAASGGSTPPPPPPPTAPAAPGNLQAQAVSQTEVQLTWADNSTNEDAFRVERKVNGVFQEVQATAANATGARITGLSASTLHTFRVRATNSAGASSYSNEAGATTPGYLAPGNLVATTVSSTEIRLTWVDNSTNETSFLLERITDGVFKQFRMTGANIITIKLTSLTPGTRYTFRVRAAIPGGYTDYSNTATATTLGGTTATLASPRPLKARAVSANEVELTWEDRSKGETSYRIEKLVDGVYREIRSVGPGQTRARVSGLSPGRPYTFRVRATSADGSSPYSNVVKVTTKSRAR